MVYIAIKDESNDENDKMTLISHISKNDTWIIDTGFSHHMTSDKSKFENLVHYDGGSVRFGNDEPCYVKGKGFITLTNNLKCDNSYWVEGMKYNLLSVAQLNNIGFKVEFMNENAILLDGKGNLVGTGKKTKGNLLYLDLNESSCFISQVEEVLLWHKRLCHVNFDNLVNISKNKRAKGIPSLKKLDMGKCKNF